MTDREPTVERPFRFGLFVFIVLTVLVVAAFGFILMRPPKPTRASIELYRKLAQLRKDGVPLDAADLGSSLPDPDAEHDARLVLSAAFAWSPGAPATTNVPVVGGLSLKRGEPIPLHVMSELTMFLTNSDALLAAIPAQLDGTRFCMGWANGIGAGSFTPLVQVRRPAQMLALKSFYEAERRDSQKAADALNAGFRLAQTLNDDNLAGAMIRVAVLGLMCEAAEQVLNRTKLTDPQLLSLRETIYPELADDFTHAFMVERYFAATMFEGLRTAYNNGGTERARLALWSAGQWIFGNRKPAYRDEDYLLYLNILDERRTAQSLPGFERLQRSEQLDEQYKRNSHSAAADLAFGAHLIKAMRAAIEARARLEACKTSLAIERYRLAHNGGLPDSWSALVPAYSAHLPRDPLDNQPLRFKKLPRGYVVYSIGADGVDNGGAERPKPADTNNYDVTFTVER